MCPHFVIPGTHIEYITLVVKELSIHSSLLFSDLYWVTTPCHIEEKSLENDFLKKKKKKSVKP